MLPHGQNSHRSYSETVFQTAVHAVRSGLMTYGKAAKAYGIPKTTLYMHRKENSPKFAAIGRVYLLKESEEDSLAAYMNWCEDHGIPFTYQLLKSFTREILNARGVKGKVCQKWSYLFAKRHNFSPRKSRQQEPSRSVAGSSPQLIIPYFQLLKEKIVQLGLEEKPECIWNADEKGWSKMQCLMQPVLVSKGKPQAKTRKIFTNEHITTMHAINGKGNVSDRTYVLFSKNIPTTMDVRNLPQKWGYGTSESGYMNKELFFIWFRDLFLPSIGRNRPQILTYDAASSHVSVNLIELAMKEKISIIQLPGKTTAFLQPLDQIFSQLSSTFSEIAYNLCFTKFDFLVRPKNFPNVLSQAIDKAWPKELVKNAFKITGMYPTSLEELCSSHHLSETCKCEIQKFLTSGEMPEAQETDDVEAVTAVEDPAPAIEKCKKCGNPPCDLCIQTAKKKTNVLFKAGLITENLVTILDPPDVPSSRGKLRLTKAKCITVEDMLNDEREKEESLARKKGKRNNSTCTEHANVLAQGSRDEGCVSDDLPTILPPKRARNNKKTGNTKDVPATEVTNGQKDTCGRPDIACTSNDYIESDDIRRSHRSKKVLNYAQYNENGDQSSGYVRSNYQETVCPKCNVLYSTDDDDLNIHWYGCDLCEKWWHRDCLSEELRAKADLSCMDESVQFRCPACPVLKLCNVCFVEGTEFFCQCDNCYAFYHFDCIPEQLYIEYKVLKENNKTWFCTKCEVDE